MRSLLLISVSLIILSCSVFSDKADSQNTRDALYYEVDLNNRDDDTFDVTLYVNNLTSDNNIYQFAASAPGTYRTMDMGRFVRRFYALNSKGDTLQTEQISTNQWRLYDPINTNRIIYEIAETWDTPVDSNSIYVMCGTSLEKDHTLINGQAVFGFPKGMQQRPVEVKLIYPDEWLSGTALHRTQNGTFRASDYDRLVDSPILLGKLTKAETDVDGTLIDVYAYSKNDMIKAAEIMNSVHDILKASNEFLDGLPVEHYTFLFHFENKNTFGAGAWEHNYSSIYTFPEAPIETMIKYGLPGTMAHEFFHIITPLHIHSERVAQFNFENPQPSEHLWLYEGTTEWAAKIMQLRSGLITPEEYLGILSRKLNASDRIDPEYSLSELSLNSFSVKGQKEYGDIYMRGALTAGLLDLRLLQLSDGKRGLREVILELIDTYGVNKSFDEKTFFQTLTKMTYPEIADFFNKYIKNSEALPLEEYYSWVGIKYLPSLNTGAPDTTFGWTLTADEENRLIFKEVDEQAQAMGIHNQDILLTINGQEISMKNIREIYNDLKSAPFDESFDITIEHDDAVRELKIKKIVKTKIEKHVFELMPEPTTQQQKLREIWLKNL